MPSVSYPREVLSFLSATGKILFHKERARLLNRENDSVASSDIATLAMRHGARMITHLFNAMPQLHHRDPTIIGLLGASPHLSSPLSPISLYPAPNLASGTVPSDSAPNSAVVHTTQSHAEAIDTTDTPPQTPGAAAASGASTPLLLPRKGSRTELHLEKGEVTDMAFVRPFYGMIVDGIHSHPNSVRVSMTPLTTPYDSNSICRVTQLAYSAHPEGCILVTDGKYSGVASYDLWFHE